MNTTQLHEESIFLEALEFADEEKRVAIIADRCGDDVALRERITELLNLNDSDCILDQDAKSLIGFDEDRESMPKVGSTIGNYKLLREIGVGGMGVVFKAQQNEPVQRKVAIKVIKLGMDTRNVIARFEAERQTLALMDHPYITQVFDAGATETGRPYFVMELVRGTAINKYCDAKKLTIRERLQLFVRACQGIQHAHQKEIVHRDIKPTNVLVANHDGEAIPKIIDFGIAKATNRQLAEKTNFTNFGEMIGTPMYMSPEQAEMSEPDVDTRSDIYSLGVVLYELLTGSPPFAELRDSGFNRIREAIKTVEPQLASTSVIGLTETRDEVATNRRTDLRTLSRVIKGDLDWILSRCLAKSRSQRYQTAGDLARDIQRYLNGEPVEAAAPTMGYRASKFVERNRVVVLTGGLVALVLICCATVATLFGLNSMRMEERAQHAEKITLEALNDAKQNRDRAVVAEQRLASLAREKDSKKIIVYQAVPTERLEAMLLSSNTFQDVSGMGPVSSDRDVFYSLQALEDYSDEHISGPFSVEVRETERWIDNADDLADLKPTKKSDSHVADGKSPSASKKKCDEYDEFKYPGTECPDPKCPETRTQIRVVKKIPATTPGRVMVFDAVEMLALQKRLEKLDRQHFGVRERDLGERIAKLGLLCASCENWAEAEQCFRISRSIFDQTLDYDSPDLILIRLWLSEAMLAQDKFETAGQEIQAISSDVECMFERLPAKVAHLLSRLKFQASKVLGKEI